MIRGDCILCGRFFTVSIHAVFSKGGCSICSMKRRGVGPLFIWVVIITWKLEAEQRFSQIPIVSTLIRHVYRYVVNF